MLRRPWASINNALKRLRKLIFSFHHSVGRKYFGLIALLPSFSLYSSYSFWVGCLTCTPGVKRCSAACCRQWRLLSLQPLGCLDMEVAPVDLQPFVRIFWVYLDVKSCETLASHFIPCISGKVVWGTWAERYHRWMPKLVDV